MIGVPKLLASAPHPRKGRELGNLIGARSTDLQRIVADFVDMIVVATNLSSCGEGGVHMQTPGPWTPRDIPSQF